MPESGNTYLATLKKQLDATGDPVATSLAHLAGHLEAYALNDADQPLRAMVFDPLLDQTVYSAETLLDVLEHPPLGSPPDLSTLRGLIPADDVATLCSAEAILRRRAGTGDAELAELLALARVRGQAPAERESPVATWVHAAVAAARALVQAGAGARLEIPTPRHGGENVDPA